jgi:tetratricopeptide (TPR) repeat protein
MKQHRFVWRFFCLAIAVVAVVLLCFFFFPNRNVPQGVLSSPDQDQSPSTREKGANTVPSSSPPAPIVPDFSELTSRSAKGRVKDFQSSKGDRIAELHAQLHGQGVRVTGPIPEEIAILTEGMDTLSAAQFLREHGIYDYAIEYARKAVAEEEEKVEPLLLLGQLLDPINQSEEREFIYHQILQIHPNSTDALVGLGQTFIWGSQPWEAIPYLEDAILRDPSSIDAYRALGIGYERSGLYDEALEAYRKAYEIVPDEVAARHIRLLEEGRPFYPPVPLQPPEVPPGKETSQKIPSQQEEVPIEDPTGKLESEPNGDQSPPLQPEERFRPQKNAEEQREVEAFLRMIDEYERAIDKGWELSEADGQWIADLKRSVESNPNRSESYLELARAYEKAGYPSKAADVYQRALKRFPQDSRVRRESSAFVNKRERSSKPQKIEASDSSKED